MKLTFNITVGLLAAGLTAVVYADDIKITVPGAPAASTAPATAPAATATPAPAPAPAFTEQQLMEAFGWLIGRRIGLGELGFTPEQVQTMAKGMAVAAEGKELPYDIQKIGPAVDQYMRQKQEAFLTKAKQHSLAESAEFLTKIKQKPGVIALPDGLCYEIVKPGEGPAPKPTDTVTVNYTGTLVNGTVFDSSEHAGKPLDIELDHVIPGWTEGLQKIAKGGKIKLYIPPDLAYGDDGRPGIPPASTLIFDVELLDIKAAPAAPATPALPAESAGKK